MLLTIVIVLFVLWLLGFSFHLAASLSTVLIVLAIIALCVYLYDHTHGRRF